MQKEHLMLGMNQMSLLSRGDLLEGMLKRLSKSANLEVRL